MEKKDRITLKKIEETGTTYRIQTTVGTICLSLVIIKEFNDELLVYKSSMVREQDLETLADKLLMNVDDYFEKLIYFFENPFTVKFDFNKNTLTIFEDVNSHLQVKYFQCNLEKVSNSYVGNLIDDLHSQKSQSEIHCKELIHENELLRKDVIEYKNKLNELVDRKILDEKTMLSNFVLLLNEKKKRIQHLNELLEAFRNDSSLADPVEVNVTYRNKRKLKNIKSEEQMPQKKEEISESESDYSHHDTLTDDEHLADSINCESKYSEIFDESPTEINLPLAKLPNLNTENSEYILPSTSKGIHSDLELKEENKSPLSESHDLQMMNIDTQEWLDNL